MSCSFCFRSISAMPYGASTTALSRIRALKCDNGGLRTSLPSKMKEVSN